MLAILLRFLLPVLIFYLILKVLFRMNQEARKNKQNENKKGQGQIIDICPDCGEVYRPGHRC